MRRLKIGLFAAALLLIGAPLHWTLPRTSIVVMTGSEVKRMDDGAGGTRDVYFIFTEDPETKAPRVYRNEDTGFGFPPYFKFASANLQSRAGSLAADRARVAVTHYGWRIPMISAFPNAVSIKPVEADYRHIPLFNILFFSSLLGLGLLLRSRIRRMIAGLPARGASRATPAATPAAAANPADDVSDWMTGEDRPVGGAAKDASKGGLDV
jgi:hypothetical protein